MAIYTPDFQALGLSYHGGLAFKMGVFETDIFKNKTIIYRTMATMMCSNATSYRANTPMQSENAIP
jgi:hypothetical protein